MIISKKDFNTESINWKTSDNQQDVSRIEGDELHLFKTDQSNTYSCILPSDSEYGSIVLDLEVNSELLEKAFELKLVSSVDYDNDMQSENEDLPQCTPGENC